MMSNLVRTAGKFLQDNSPGLLTAVGVVGTVSTAVLTARSTFRAADILAEVNSNDGTIPDEDIVWLTPQEKIRLVWKVYLPPVVTGTLTCAAIIGANYIGQRRAAALAAAYALSERAFADYKQQVVQKFGERKEQQVRDDLAQNLVSRHPVDESTIISTGGGNVLCFDQYTGRYFYSDMETLRQAENAINHVIINSYYASLTEFYSYLGLPPTKFSDEVGWNSDRLMALHISTTISEDQRPCLSLDFAVSPIRGYWKAK